MTLGAADTSPRLFRARLALSCRLPSTRSKAGTAGSLIFTAHPHWSPGLGWYPWMGGRGQRSATHRRHLDRRAGAGGAPRLRRPGRRHADAPDTICTCDLRFDTAEVTQLGTPAEQSEYFRDRPQHQAQIGSNLMCDGGQGGLVVGSGDDIRCAEACCRATARVLSPSQIPNGYRTPRQLTTAAGPRSQQQSAGRSLRCCDSPKAVATGITGGVLSMRQVMQSSSAAAQREQIGPGAQLFASDQHIVA
jgi:hypothetical protein